MRVRILLGAHRMYQNLHSHTIASDGELDHKQVLDICSKNKISVVAFTDHDALPNKKALDALTKNKSHSTKWIIGVEISSGWPKEIGGPANNFHIVGLFVDPKNKALLEHCQKAKDGRMQRMKKMVANLRSLGFLISENDCLKESGGEIVGRLHIASALLKKEINLQIIEKLRQKMEKSARTNIKIKKKYDSMIKAGQWQHVFSLFLDPEAYLPNIYADYEYWLDMDKSVEMIRMAGGIAILAHWSFSKNKVGERMIAKFFQEKRLDGAEITFGSYKAIDAHDSEIKNDLEIIKKLTEKHNVLQSGGGDTHKKTDFELFVREKWFAERTIGLVKKMAKIKTLNLKFSSL